MREYRWYGVTGYCKFVLYNRYIAESITNQGRQIICSAAEGFEGFLSDNVAFVNESELFHYIHNILNEYKDNYKDKLDLSHFHITESKFKVVKRLVNKCDFNINDKAILHIEELINNLSEDELCLLYYKNNLLEFNKLGIIKDKMGYIINNLASLRAPELHLIEDDKIKELITSIWDFYKVFVFYNFPIFDRVRKSMYVDKKAVLYVDTDSNFLGLNNWIQFIKKDVLNNVYNKPEKEVEFIAVNICTLFLSNVVDAVLKTLCRSTNITEEYSKLLLMKNEFYMEKILFTDKKKRYIANALLQEGQLLGDGLGLPEIKGFDFKKSTVKPFVTEYFTDICITDILRTKDITIPTIFKKMLELKKDIDESMRKGESKYFKQGTVQIIEHYANPYSMQGVKGVILWNTLLPDYHLELPVDVDIVPIKDLSDKNTCKWFEERYPEEFTKIKQNIYGNKLYYKKADKNNPEKERRIMNLNFIAKPKNYDKELPPWFGEIVNTDKVINDMLSLFYPILKSLGLKMLTTTKNSEHLSNIINL